MTYKMYLLGAVLLALPTIGMADEEQAKMYALAIHGGAGRPPAAGERRQGREAVLSEVLTEGKARLARGEASLDVVEFVVRQLEDSPFFNAGKGAVMNSAGNIQLDASIMDGRDRSGGAVGGVHTVRNPISLARRVMTDTAHVLLVTDGAELFADECEGIERVPNTYFATEYQRKKLLRVQAKRKDMEPIESRGTVGCVALDLAGNMAAATSTGGLVNKRFGRLGDTPILTAGTYADNETCAVSCTGTGEDFIRNAVAFDVAARMRYRGDSLEEAAKSILVDKDRTVRGGLIAVDAKGNVTLPFNSAGMARAAADARGLWVVEVGE